MCDRDRPEELAECVREVAETRGGLQRDMLFDVHADVSCMNIKLGTLPCLTASRGSRGGLHITTKNRATTIHELGRLQGWHTSSIDKALDGGAKINILGRALGDGASVNVLYRLLPRALWSAGLLERKTRDVFKVPPSEARGLSGFFPDALCDLGP